MRASTASFPFAGAVVRSFSLVGVVRGAKNLLDFHVSFFLLLLLLLRLLRVVTPPLCVSCKKRNKSNRDHHQQPKRNEKKPHKTTRRRRNKRRTMSFQCHSSFHHVRALVLLKRKCSEKEIEICAGAIGTKQTYTKKAK